MHSRDKYVEDAPGGRPYRATRTIPPRKLPIESTLLFPDYASVSSVMLIYQYMGLSSNACTAGVCS